MSHALTNRIRKNILDSFGRRKEKNEIKWKKQAARDVDDYRAFRKLGIFPMSQNNFFIFSFSSDWRTFFFVSYRADLILRTRMHAPLSWLMHAHARVTITRVSLAFFFFFIWNDLIFGRTVYLYVPDVDGHTRICNLYVLRPLSSFIANRLHEKKKKRWRDN